MSREIGASPRTMPRNKSSNRAHRASASPLRLEDRAYADAAAAAERYKTPDQFAEAWPEPTKHWEDQRREYRTYAPS